MKRSLTATVLAGSVAALCIAVASALGAAKSPARPSATVVMPKVVGMRMDRATRTLHSRGLRVNEECSGLLGCWVKSRWWVCHQSPRAGKRVRRYSVVVIYAERRGEC